MFKRNTRLYTALIAAVSVIAISAKPATAQATSSLDEYPVVTIGDLAGFEPETAAVYATGMLETAAYIAVTINEDVDAARCIAAQKSEIIAVLFDKEIDQTIEMPLTGMIASVSCKEGSMTGDADLTGTEEFASMIGETASYEVRALYLLGSRDFLLNYVEDDVSAERLACISDSYVAGFDNPATYSKAVASDETGVLITAVIGKALDDCL